MKPLQIIVDETVHEWADSNNNSVTQSELCFICSFGDKRYSNKIGHVCLQRYIHGNFKKGNFKIK